MVMLSKVNINFTKDFIKERKQKELGLPKYSTFEEVLNALTHGIGALLAIAAIVLLVVFSAHTPMTITCVSIYASTLFITYIVSTIYHALKINYAKKVFRILDHCSIFFLIAGTYTPLSLVLIGGTVGWVLFGIIWASAIFGVIINSIDMKKFSKLSSICYICMGWCVLFAFKPLINKISVMQLVLLLVGGIAYTIGAVIYNIGKKNKYMHSVWHVFVLIGSILHFFFIFNYCINL